MEGLSRKEKKKRTHGHAQQYDNDGREGGWVGGAGRVQSRGWGA